MTPVPTIAIRFIGLFNGTICPPCKIANLLFLHVPCHCRTCDTQCKWLKEWDIADKRDLKTSQCSYRSGNPLSRASRLPPESVGEALWLFPDQKSNSRFVRNCLPTELKKDPK